MAYKVFTNGSPLPASDLNTYLMNQSVMVFANSTARSAAIPTPTEGMVTYLEDTNKVEVYTGSPLAWTDINDNSNAILKSTVTATGDLIVGNGNASVTRLGIGANGTFLSSNGTTATWASISGGGLTELATGSLSGGETIISSISQSYKSLVISLRDLQQSAGNDSYVAFRNGTTTLDLNRIGAFWNGSSRTEYAGNSTFSTIFNTGTSSDQAGSMIYQIWNYATTSPKSFIGFGAGMESNSRAQYVFGSVYSASAVNSIRFAGDGNWTGGTYTIWGVN